MKCHENMRARPPAWPAARKIAASTAATILGIVTLGACGSSDSDAESNGDADGETLSIQTPWDQASPFNAPFAQIVEEFEAETGITVTVESSASEQVRQIFTNRVLAGDAPDIVFSNPTREALSWVEQEATVAVDEYVAEWGLSDVIYDEALSEVNWLTDDGQLRGLPLAGFVWPTWYTQDSLGAINGQAPMGADDVEAYVAGLDGRDSVVVGGADWSGFNAFMMTLQVYLTDDELNILVAEGGWAGDATARQGVEWFVALRELGFWSPNSTGQTVDGANAAFQGGQAEGLTLISDYFPDVPDELADTITLGGIPIPDDATVEAPVVMTAYTGSGVMISAAGAEENLEAIRQFVEFLYDPQQLGHLVSDGNMIVAADAEVSDTTAGSALLTQANSAEFRERVTFVGASNIPTEIVENLTRAASLAWTTGATTDDILEAMDAVY